MSEYQLLNLSVDDRGVATVTLMRSEIHNAFNDKLIDEVTSVFNKLEKDDNVRIAVLTGDGRSFCAGADLNWMKSMIDYSMDENIKDSLKLATMFETLNSFSKPLIGKINGHALGGGVGLVSVCDFAITHDKSKFGFTEARLGLVPAVISPYCINKIGESQARAWFLSGEMFGADQALKMNLLHKVTTVELFEEEFVKLICSFLKAGPIAAKESKKLITNVVSIPTKDLQLYTCETIAARRISDEGQEGMSALLNKRKAKWVIDEN